MVSPEYWLPLAGGISVAIIGFFLSKIWIDLKRHKLKTKDMEMTGDLNDLMQVRHDILMARLTKLQGEMDNINDMVHAMYTIVNNKDKEHRTKPY